MMKHGLNEIDFFSVIQRSEDTNAYEISSIHEAIQCTEKLGFKGLLLFQNNDDNLDPWVFGQEVFRKSGVLSPFIAVNPLYMHPFTAAKKVLSLTSIYKRKVYLNFITGTSKSALESLGDNLTPNERYDRLEEYIEIVDFLLRERRPLNFSGKYFSLKNLQLSYSLPTSLYPEYFLAGSSERINEILDKRTGQHLAMAKPLEWYKKNSSQCFSTSGLHFGILARKTKKEAWASLNQLYPNSNETQLVHQFSMENTDSKWKKELNEEAAKNINYESGYCLLPFKHFKADCPFYVGSYAQVAKVFEEYIRIGITCFVLEITNFKTELDHINKVLNLIEQTRDKSGALDNTSDFSF